MNILFITETYPYPTDTGGKIRTFNILRGLSLDHNVILVTTFTNERQLSDLSKLEQYCSEVHVVKKKNKSLFHLAFIVIKNLFLRLPLLVHQHFNPSLADKINHILTRESPPVHAVHFDHLDSSIYLKYLDAHQLKILDEHNVVTNQVITSYKVEKNIFFRILLKSQIKKTRRYEAEVVRKMDLCFVCSEMDKEHLRKFTANANIDIIPNGVDIQYFSQPQVYQPEEIEHLEKKKTLIFVGTLDYGPGEAAILYFLEEIYPLLQAKDSEINFLAVGQNPSNRLLKFSNKNIIFTGRVEDIRPYVAKASIFVVPLLSGSGTRLKILDAMAMKIPVVSTSIGAEGLDVHHKKNIMLADSPHDFMHSIIFLQKKPSLMKTIVENGFQLVNNYYTWEIVWKKLLATYKNLTFK